MQQNTPTDAELSEINALFNVSQVARTGRAMTGVAYKATTEAAFAELYIDRDDLGFDVGTPDRNLGKHRLLVTNLQSGSEGLRPLRSALASRNAAGRNVVETLAIGLPVNIARRAALCIRLLSGGDDMPFNNEARTFIQRVLSNVLLDYPVLLHPKFLIPAYRQGELKAFTPMLFEMAAHGIALPRASHFPGDQLAQDTAKRLVAFAHYPVVRSMLLNPRGICVYPNDPKGKDSDAVVKVSKCLSDYVMDKTQPRPGFLASVMELDDIAPELRSGDAKNLPKLPLMAEPAIGKLHGGYENTVERVRTLQSLTMMVFSASGMRYSTSSVVRSGVPLSARLIHDGEFDGPALDTVRSRIEGLGLGGFSDDVGKYVARMLFISRFDERTPDDIARNTKCLVASLQRVGLAGSSLYAGVFIVNAVLGLHRKDMVFPSVEVPHVLAFLRELDAAGGLGEFSPDESGAQRNIALERHTHAVTAVVPGQFMSHRDRWLAGVQAFHAERAMKVTVDAALARVAAAPQSGFPAPVDAADDIAPRRRRMGV